MNVKVVLFLGLLVVALFGTMMAVGCGSKPAPDATPVPGPAEKAGAALDKAVEKSGEAVNKLADKTSEATKDAANKAVQKTGEVLEKAGAAVQKTGEDMKNDQNTPAKP